MASLKSYFDSPHFAGRKFLAFHTAVRGEFLRHFLFTDVLRELSDGPRALRPSPTVIHHWLRCSVSNSFENREPSSKFILSNSITKACSKVKLTEFVFAKVKLPLDKSFIASEFALRFRWTTWLGLLSVSFPYKSHFFSGWASVWLQLWKSPSFLGSFSSPFSAAAVSPTNPSPQVAAPSGASPNANPPVAGYRIPMVPSDTIPRRWFSMAVDSVALRLPSHTWNLDMTLFEIFVEFYVSQITNAKKKIK